MKENAERVRLDRWLWAARIYKSRSLATRAIIGGKARLGGRRVKPGASITLGDIVQVRKGPYEIELIVRGIAERRGPARVAAGLYEESAASRTAREALAAALDRQASIEYQGKGRPTKRDRRRLDRLLDEWIDEQ
jgi:ribosome-associated heat shock protein Hsp15